jgi:hypothetical protein
MLIANSSSPAVSRKCGEFRTVRAHPTPRYPLPPAVGRHPLPA